MASGGSELNQRFLADIPRNARILEVGCNEGNQLCALQEMGFQNLYWIENRTTPCARRAHE